MRVIRLYRRVIRLRARVNGLFMPANGLALPVSSDERRAKNDNVAVISTYRLPLPPRPPEINPRSPVIADFSHGSTAVPSSLPGIVFDGRLVGARKSLRQWVVSHKMRRVLPSSGRSQENPPMAKDETRRISPKVLAEDSASLEALETIDNYAPANPNLTLANLRALKADMDSKQAAETRKEAELAAARDDATAAEWAYHNAIVGMRDQAVAQFGRSSNQAQSVGRKKATERK
ncbi:MAG TPA: hypothetical protein VF658_02120 [Pyrinomonadaceae bacterium]|jgi:hypothetical protein